MHDIYTLETYFKFHAAPSTVTLERAKLENTDCDHNLFLALYFSSYTILPPHIYTYGSLKHYLIF